MIERGAWRGLRRHLDLIVTIAGISLVVLLWWTERFFAPDDYRLSFVYLFPVVAVSWWGIRRAAVACAAIASVALVSNDLTLRPLATPSAIAWNEFTRVVTMFAVALLLLALRSTSERAISQSEHAFRMAVTDSLTGLYNRRYLVDQLTRLESTAKRFGRSYSLLSLDVDEFKHINDLYGHGAGDRALTIFANDLMQVIRAGDIAVRLGGDEFVVVLPEATVADGVAVAKRLARVIARRAQAREIRSVSVGVVPRREHGGIDELLAEADQLVYESKRAGGGLVKTPSTGF